MKNILSHLIFSFIIIFSFESVNGQEVSLIKYPDSIKQSKNYISPYSIHFHIPSIYGFLMLGDNYDSLYNYEYSIFDFFESDDIIRNKRDKYEGLEIIVDTTQEIDLHEYFSKKESYKGLFSSPKYISYINSENNKVKFQCTKDTIIKFKGNAVYILNKTQNKKSIFLKSSFVEILQEALDKNGKWQPIEKVTTFMCGNGFGWREMRPNEFLVTATFKYKGDYKTLIRLKFVNGKVTYYSKPFNGSINYSQLNQKGIRYIDD